MSLLDILLFWFSCYISVFFLGLQSRNVNTGRYGWAAGTSLCIAVTQTTSFRGIVALPLWEVYLVVCTAGPLSVVSAMLFSHHMLEKRSRQKTVCPCCKK